MPSSIRNSTEHSIAIKSAKNVVILCICRDCPACVKQRPYYEKISKLPKMEGVRFFLMVETRANEPFMNKLNIEYYPAMFLYKNGKKVYEIQEYVGYYDMIDLFSKKFSLK